jgi:dipeptidyl aminopeptidase/acylaminoacyl peptidase
MRYNGPDSVAGRALSPEDLYRLVLVSSPTTGAGDDDVFFVVSRVEKDRYYPTIWRARGSRVEPLVTDRPAMCPAASPDGDKLAFVSVDRDKKESILALLDLESRSIMEVLRSKRPILRAEWLDSRRLAIQSWESRGDKPYNERDYLDVNRLPVYFNGVGWTFDSYKSLSIVEVYSGHRRRITPEGVNVGDFAVAPNGKVIVYSLQTEEMHPYYQTLVAHNIETDERRELSKKIVISGLAVSPDSSRVAVRGHFWERGAATHHKVYTVDLSGGRLSCISCELGLNTVNSVNSDVRGPSCSKPLAWRRDKVLFPVHSRGSVLIYESSEESEPKPVVVSQESVVDEFAMTRKGGIYYTMMTSSTPKELYMEGGGKLTSFNEWLAEYDLAEPLHGAVRRESVDIDYWVLPPASTDCKGCVPWVLYIHGGPKTSFGHGFMFEFHVLAAKGYAVVYSNPRGSDGYSEDFADIRGKYGTVDYDDLMAVTRSVEREYDWLSNEKKAVAGGSYGGWMTNHIISSTSDFASAVTMRSCSNWSSFFFHSDL